MIEFIKCQFCSRAYEEYLDECPRHDPEATIFSKSTKWRQGDGTYDHSDGYFFHSEQGPVGPYKSEESAQKAWEARL